MKIRAIFLTVLSILFFIFAYVLYNKIHSQYRSNCYPVPKNGKIERSGCYILRKNTFFNKKAKPIRILANNVELDLGAHKIYSINDRSKNLGIECQHAENVKIRNGILDEIYNNILLDGCKNVEITNLKFSHVRNIAIGIANSSHVTIQHNHLLFNNLYSKFNTKEFYFVGVNVGNSKNVDINSNIIQAIFPTKNKSNLHLELVGVLVSSDNNKNIIISKNKLLNFSYGIRCLNAGNIVTRNEIILGVKLFKKLNLKKQLSLSAKFNSTGITDASLLSAKGSFIKNNKVISYEHPYNSSRQINKPR